jgi:hypothetical protein
MNQQIEKLTFECGAWHQVYGNRNFMIDEHFDIEKFARLIVQECLQVINQPNGVGDDDVIKISRDVKKHFGVES